MVASSVGNGLVHKGWEKGAWRARVSAARSEEQLREVRRLPIASGEAGTVVGHGGGADSARTPHPQHASPFEAIP